MARKRDKTVWVESEGPTGYIRPTTRLEVVANMLEAIRRDTFVTREAFFDKRLIEDVTGAPLIERGSENDDLIGFHAGGYGPKTKNRAPDGSYPEVATLGCHITNWTLKGRPTVDYRINVLETYDDLEFDKVKELLPERWEIEDPNTVLRSPPHTAESEVIVYHPPTGKHGNDTTFHYLTTKNGAAAKCELVWTPSGTLWLLDARKVRS